jgi:hypothetical protein
MHHFRETKKGNLMRGRRSFIAVVVLAVILIAGFPGNAPGAEWIYFATTEKGQHYYDKQTIKRSSANVRVWEKAIYSEQGRRNAEAFLTEMGKYKGQTPGHVLTLDEFNCRETKGRSLSMIIYDIQGKRVASSPEGGSEWSNIVPDSVYERLSNVVCK